MTTLNQTTQQRIMDSTRVLYIHSDNGNPTMDEVARATGIGRATLYRHFRNRDELLLAVIEAEANEIAAIVERKIRRMETPAEYIIEGVVHAREEINRSELFGSMLKSSTSGTVNRLLFNSDRLTNIGLDIMMPVVERARDSSDLGTDMPFDMLMEWIMRMLVSLISTPSKNTKNNAALRKMLHKTMLPVLEPSDH